ncbi:MAG: hypothetical protein M0036_00180 [Desulfobacteraceae bacterium]|nr:hypothetical protein [Desulfobacteraceae bacterium]
MPTPTPTHVAAFCGNPVSRIYHAQSHWCGAEAAHFETRQAAEAAGYRACGICGTR